MAFRRRRCRCSRRTDCRGSYENADVWLRLGGRPGRGKARGNGRYVGRGGTAAMLFAGAAMGGSLFLAEASIEAALAGEQTPIDYAGEAYVNLAVDIQENGLEQVWYERFLR